MTTLEIILMCVIVWLVGIVVIFFWNEKPRGEELLIFIWFIAIPVCSIYESLKHRKVPYNVKSGWDENHACILKLPFGWEKFIKYSDLYVWGNLTDKENFTEQDVAENLKNLYSLSKRKIRYIRKTKQLTKITNKLKEKYR